MSGSTNIGKISVQVEADLKKYKSDMNTIAPTAEKETGKVEKAFSDMGKDVGRSADTYKQALDKMEKQTVQASANVAKNMKSFEKGFSDAINGLSTAGAGVGAVAVKLASDAAESESMFEQSFEGMATAAREWSVKLRKELGMNEYELRKNSGMMFTMLDSMGLAKDAAYEMSTGLTMLSEDMASFYNIASSDAFAKIRSGITGQTEPLMALGINLTENTVKSYAYALGIAKVGEELNAQQKVLARYQAIMIQTTKAQGQFAREINSLPSQMRIAKNEAAMLSIELGQELIPAYIKLVSMAKNVMTVYKDMSEENQKATKALAAWAVMSASAISSMRLMGTAIGVSVGLWAKLAVAIGLAVASLAEFLEEQSKIDSYSGNTMFKDGDKLKVSTNDAWYAKMARWQFAPFGQKPFTRDATPEEVAAQEIYLRDKEWAASKGERPPLNDKQREALAKSETEVEEATKKQIERVKELMKEIDAAQSAAKSKGDTALQQYLSGTQKLLSIGQGQMELGQITGEQYLQLLGDRLKGLNNVAVAEDEILDKQQAQLDLQVQSLNVARELAEESADKRLFAADSLAADQRARLDSEMEARRHAIEMMAILSDDSLAAVRASLELEIELTREGLAKQFELEDRAVERKLEILREAGMQETNEYRSLLEEKKRLKRQYDLETETANNMHLERMAEQQKVIIDANNDMIADLITGTRSGHDILKDMWGDFVFDVVSKMFSIKSEMNIFTELLGGIFGLSGSKSSEKSLPNFDVQKRAIEQGLIPRESGGPVTAGKAYLVGEKRPEVFVPQYNGTIIPDVSMLSSGGQTGQVTLQPQININQTFQSLDPAENMRLAKLQNEATKNDILNAIRNESVWRSAIKGATT